MSDAPSDPSATADSPVDESLQNQAEQGAGEEGAADEPKLNLVVTVDTTGACERHITVEVSREDIDRYFEEAIDDLAPKAEVPGFRPGKAPRKLVAARFKQQVQDQVKGSLLMDSMQQVTDESDFSAISEPELNFGAIVLPESGPLTFEFDIEVRPEFDVPQWKGLSLERPVKDVDDEDVDKHLKKVLAKYGKMTTVEQAEVGDTLSLDATFVRDGATISRIADASVILRPKLSFGNAELEGFDQLAQGAKVGDDLTAQLTISDEDSDESLRGAEVEAKFKILKIERRELPQLTHSFLEQIGGFEDEEELRDTIRKELIRQLHYHQQRRLREQISELLTAHADWELPPALLRRQASRELERAVMELEASGFSVDEINTYINQLRRNSLRSTAAALKEHFILERIAEDLEIDAEPQDYEVEIQLIAAQRDEPARRVRARMEKRGQLDTLRNQIIERKVLEQIREHANFKDIPFEAQPTDTFALPHQIGHRAEIAEAEHEDNPDLRKPS